MSNNTSSDKKPKKLLYLVGGVNFLSVLVVSAVLYTMLYFGFYKELYNQDNIDNLPETGAVRPKCPGCFIDDICYPGNENDKCGLGGVPCVACDFMENCDDLGVCTGIPKICDKATCHEGCCIGDSCKEPNNDHCGLEGEICDQCTIGENCINGNCQKVCTTEVCDGYDNDCDGQIDENLSRNCGV